MCSTRHPHEPQVHFGCRALYASPSIFSLTLQQRINTSHCNYLRDSDTGYSLSQYCYGETSFSCIVSIFSLFQIVKEQYLKHDLLKSSLRYSGDNVFHSLSDGVPKGIRTPVTAVKGRCPRPLDDGDTKIPTKSENPIVFCIIMSRNSRHQQVLLLITIIRQSVWTLRNAYL